MTIDKAIEILTFVRQTGQYVCDCEDEDALKLSLEVLKLLATQPPEGYTCIPRPLPGETKE